MKQKELTQIIENTVKKVLSEDFKNKKIQEFFKLIKSDLKGSGHSPSLYRLNTVQWSEIPDDDRIKLLQGMDDIKSYIKNDSYYIFWINMKDKKLVKWKEPRYTPYGYKQDRSIYARKGLVAISKGIKFQTIAYQGDKTYTDIEYSVDKPNGIGSVKGVSEISDYALCIPADLINEYNSKPLQTSRSTARSGAIALKNLDSIRIDNINRYKAIIKKNKITDKSKEYDVKYKEILAEFLKIYKDLSQNLESIEDIFDFDKKIGRLKDEFKTFASAFNNTLYYIKEVENNPGRNWYVSTMQEYTNSFNAQYSKIKELLLDF